MIFCGHVACYAVVKHIVHTLYMMLFSDYGGGIRTAGKKMVRILLVAAAVVVRFMLLMLTPYADWVLGIATLLCARITWREFKTIGGIRADDWDRAIGECMLFDFEDWLMGIGDVISGQWSILDLFRCSGDSSYRESRKIDDFYYDARWYYDYGDGKNS